MKRELKSAGAWWALVMVLALGSRLPAVADFPVPSYTFYGEVRNAYGWPYTQVDDVQVIVRVDERECGRTTVDERLGPGINFRVEVPLDNGQGARYADFAARSNEQPTFAILSGGGEYVVMDSASAPSIGAPGDAVRLNFFRDTDADSDDLPDVWEQMILIASGGTFTDISEILPDDDFDGDGMSNGNELIAGTDPTWDVDLLAVDAFEYLPEIHQVGLGFYSVRAKTYEVQGTGSLTDWQEQEFSANSTNSPVQKFWRGDGYYSWLFVDALTNSHQMFRLEAQ